MCKPIAFNKAKTIKANGSITELSYDANQKRAMQRIGLLYHNEGAHSTLSDCFSSEYRKTSAIFRDFFF
jgi:hypothetical protein